MVAAIARDQPWVLGRTLMPIAPACRSLRLIAAFRLVSPATDREGYLLSPEVNRGHMSMPPEANRET